MSDTKNMVYEIALPYMVLTRDDLDKEYEDCSDEQLKEISSLLEELLMDY